nr:PREDICTED: serine/arginine repetitive matrix protein 1-like [Megachile rotundata]
MATGGLPVVRCIEVLAPPRTVSSMEGSTKTSSEMSGQKRDDDSSEMPGQKRNDDPGSETGWISTRRSARLSRAPSDASETGRGRAVTGRTEVLPKVKERKVAPKKKVVNEDGDSESDSSVISVEWTPARSDSRGSRGRGRPPTTGDYVRIAEAKERVAEAKRIEMELDKELGAYDLTRPVPAPSRGSKPIPGVEEVIWEAKYLPTVDLHAELLSGRAAESSAQGCARGKEDNGGGPGDASGKKWSVLKGTAPAPPSPPADRRPPTVRRTRRRVLSPSESEREDVKRRLVVASDSPPRALMSPMEATEDTPAMEVEQVRSVEEVARQEVVFAPVQGAGQQERQMEPPRVRKPSREEEHTRTREPQKGVAQAPGLEGVVAQLIRKVEELSAELRGVTRRRQASNSAQRRAQPKPPPRPRPAPPPPWPRPAPRRAITETEAARRTARSVAPVAAPLVAATNQGKKEETWTMVLGRKAKQQARREVQAAAGALSAIKKPVNRPQARPRAMGNKPAQPAARKRVRVPRPPRTAAVTLKVAPGGQTIYSQVLTKARESVAPKELADMGIDELKIRKAATRGLVLGIPGEEGKVKAVHLAGRLREVFGESEVKVANPTKT